MDPHLSNNTENTQGDLSTGWENIKDNAPPFHGEPEFRAENTFSSSYEKIPEDKKHDIFTKSNFGDYYFKIKKEFPDDEYTDELLRICSPVYALEKLNGINFYSSMPFEAHRRPHILLYAETPDGISAHVFYRSNSSMNWRFLPRIVDGWYDKTTSHEDSINLPTEIQAKVEHISDSEDDKIPQISNEFIGYIVNDTFDSRLSTKNNRTDISNFVTCAGELALGYFGNDYNNPFENSFFGDNWILPDPETLNIPAEKEPDFSKLICEWRSHNEEYIFLSKDGALTARCFDSLDHSLRYLFYSNLEGKTWISSIECINSKTNNLGLRENYIEPGALTTPLLEYHCKESCQDGKNGGGHWGKDNFMHYPYADMSDYLDKIPIIKKFHQYYQ